MIKRAYDLHVLLKRAMMGAGCSTTCAATNTPAPIPAPHHLTMKISRDCRSAGGPFGGISCPTYGVQDVTSMIASHLSFKYDSQITTCSGMF